MPRRARFSVYLTVSDILRLQGLPVVRKEKKRLQRRLVARERSTGANFLHRTSDAPNAPIMATLADLRRYMPELFDRREEAIEFLKESIEELRQDALEGKARDKALAARCRSLSERLKAVEQWSKVVHSGPPSGQG